MGTTASIGCRMPNGRIFYVNCRYDGDLKHVGVLLVEKYNDFAKALELLLGGDIVSLREDLGSTIRERPLDYDQLEDCEVKEAYWIGDYLLKGEGNTSTSSTRGGGMSSMGYARTIASPH